VQLLRQAVADKSLKLPDRERLWLDRIQSSVESLPDREETFIAQMMDELDASKFRAADYELS